MVTVGSPKGWGRLGVRRPAYGPPGRSWGLLAQAEQFAQARGAGLALDLAVAHPGDRAEAEALGLVAPGRAQVEGDLVVAPGVHGGGDGGDHVVVALVDEDQALRDPDGCGLRHGGSPCWWWAGVTCRGGRRSRSARTPRRRCGPRWPAPTRRPRSHRRLPPGRRRRRGRGWPLPPPSAWRTRGRGPGAGRRARSGAARSGRSARSPGRTPRPRLGGRPGRR